VTFSTGSGVLVFTHLRPIEASGVNADYEWSRTLEPSFIANGESDGTFTVNIVPGVATPDIAGYEMVTVTVSSAPVMAEKLFARVLLSLIP